MRNLEDLERVHDDLRNKEETLRIRLTNSIEKLNHYKEIIRLTTAKLNEIKTRRKKVARILYNSEGYKRGNQFMRTCKNILPEKLYNDLIEESMRAAR